MFMCSGQLFSQGESASSSHTPAGQRRETNMVFKLLAEVPHGGEHRIGRRLSKAAERAVANVTAQLVQGFQMLRRARAFGNAVQDAQTLVQANSARNAFAAGLRVA